MYDVIIIGSGPAGLTAAIYTTRANLKTLIIAGGKWGGQLMLTTSVENFPGFPEGIEGPELMMRMRKQAERFGAEIREIDFGDGDFQKQLFTVNADGESFTGKSVIIATGADTKWLGVPGEKEKIGRGVSSCAPCDAAFFRNRNVIVVGGGDSAMEEALVLSRFATNVIIVHRRDMFRASDIMQKRAKETKNIHILFNSEVVEILGDLKVEKVKLKTMPSDIDLLRGTKEELEKIIPEMLKGKVISKFGEGVVWEMPIDGVFVAIGHMPNTTAFKGIDLDKQGFAKVYDHYKTNVEGVFAAGDVHDSHYKQAITAAGFGCAAALEVEKWLRNQ